MTRIEMIREKRDAILKYLKNDMADLLKSGVDVNAYGRFARKLKSQSPTKDMRIQLMQEIAVEFGERWNSKALEQKLSKPVIAVQMQEICGVSDYFTEAENAK